MGGFNAAPRDFRGDVSVDGTFESEATETGTLNEDRFYAEAFSGATIDDRLQNAIQEASGGSTIYLEDGTYTEDITTSNFIKLIGSGPSIAGSNIGDATWTFNQNVLIRDIGLTNSNSKIVLNKFNSQVYNTSTSKSGGKIEVNADRCQISGCRGGSILLSSSTSNCIIDSSIGIVITDNGTNNTVGDIA
jgi:hypothetical protein